MGVPAIKMGVASFTKSFAKKQKDTVANAHAKKLLTVNIKFIQHLNFHNNLFKKLRTVILTLIKNVTLFTQN